MSDVELQRLLNAAVAGQGPLPTSRFYGTADPTAQQRAAMTNPERARAIQQLVRDIRNQPQPTAPAISQATGEVTTPVPVPSTAVDTRTAPQKAFGTFQDLFTEFGPQIGLSRDQVRADTRSMSDAVEAWTRPFNAANEYLVKAAEDTTPESKVSLGKLTDDFAKVFNAAQQADAQGRQVLTDVYANSIQVLDQAARRTLEGERLQKYLDEVYPILLEYQQSGEEFLASDFIDRVDKMLESDAGKLVKSYMSKVGDMANAWVSGETDTPTQPPIPFTPGNVDALTAQLARTADRMQYSRDRTLGEPDMGQGELPVPVAQTTGGQPITLPMAAAPQSQFEIDLGIDPLFGFTPTELEYVAPDYSRTDELLDQAAPARDDSSNLFIAPVLQGIAQSFNPNLPAGTALLQMGLGALAGYGRGRERTEQAERDYQRDLRGFAADRANVELQRATEEARGKRDIAEANRSNDALNMQLLRDRRNTASASDGVVRQTRYDPETGRRTASVQFRDSPRDVATQALLNSIRQGTGAAISKLPSMTQILQSIPSAAPYLNQATSMMNTDVQLSEAQGQDASALAIARAAQLAMNDAQQGNVQALQVARQLAALIRQQQSNANLDRTLEILKAVK